MSNGKPGFVNLDYSYAGDRIQPRNSPILIPSYSIANLRAGIENENSTIEFYVTNIFDKKMLFFQPMMTSQQWEVLANTGFGYRDTRTKPQVVSIRIRYRY